MGARATSRSKKKLLYPRKIVLDPPEGGTVGSQHQKSPFYGSNIFVLREHEGWLRPRGIILHAVGLLIIMYLGIIIAFISVN